MKFHAADITAILLVLAGLASSGFVIPLGDAIDAWSPGHGKPVAGFLNTLFIAAGALVRIIKYKIPTETAVVKDQTTQQDMVIAVRTVKPQDTSNTPVGVK